MLYSKIVQNDRILIENLSWSFPKESSPKEMLSEGAVILKGMGN